MIKIYFDNVEINGDNFAKITKSAKVYEQNFKLGSTICETYKISVNKDAINQIPEVVTVYENNTLIKTLYVTDYNDEDNFLVVLDLEDAMTKFNFRYDASEIFIGGKTTLGAIFEDMCAKANVDTDIDSFYCDDMEVTWYDNTYMARDYLSYIAEINAKNFRISADDKLEFIDINTTPSTDIDFEDIGDYKLGVQHTITRVVLGDWQYGTDTGETYYINEDNVYATSQSMVQHIYNEIAGFTYYNFRTNNCPLENITAGDLISFTYGQDTYPTFAQYQDINYSGGVWIGGIDVNLDSPVKQETEIVGEADRYRRIKRIVDQQNGTIIQIVEEQTEQGERMTTIEQSIDQIESEIQDIPTITAEASGSGMLTLTNLLNNRLIELRIHPTDADIIGLFASTQLKVALGLKALSRGVTFDGNEDYYYMIPDNLYYLGNVYDEFIYDGVNQKIQIIHRIGIDDNDDKYVLQEPVIEDYNYYDIIIGDGNYSIFMTTYPSAYIYIKAMIKNDYTSTLATSYELDSKIRQSASEIELSVERKVDEDFTGANIMLRINDDESEAQINADKISLAGKTIDLTAQDINIHSTNFSVNEDGEVICSNAEMENINITSGNIELVSPTDTSSKLILKSSENNIRFKTELFSNGLTITSPSNNRDILRMLAFNNNVFLKLYNEFNSLTPSIELDSQTGWITCVGLEQTSMAEHKKDFEQLKSGLDIIKDIDIYKYHLIEQDDNDKKHIGFVIGDNFKYSKEITSNDNNGVDLYSFVSVCCKAIQEQQEEINSLKEEIKKLKESDK